MFRRTVLKQLKTGSNSSEDRLRHIEAGRLFNRAVMRGNLNGYFDRALAKLNLPTRRRCLSEPLDFQYIVPGEVPENDKDRVLYKLILERMEQTEIARRERAKERRMISETLGLQKAIDTGINEDAKGKGN